LAVVTWLPVPAVRESAETTGSGSLIVCSRRLIRVLALCVAASGIPAGKSQAAQASQSAPSPSSVQQRLNQVGSGLFSGTIPPGEAIRELKSVLATDLQSAEGHFLLGIAYRMQGSPELTAEARAELVQALAIKPELVPARVYLAQLYLDIGRAGTAREALTAGLSERAGDPQLLALLAETERQLGHPERAIELARQVLQRDESFAQARYYLALALLDLRQRDEAVVELERVVRSGAKVADPNLALGTAYLDAKRVDDAIAVLGQGTTIDPSRADMRIALARALRMKGLLDKADAQLMLAKPKPAASGTPQFSQQQPEPDFYMELGLLRRQQGRLQAAADAFQKVLDLESDREEAARQLADVRQLLQGRGRKPALRDKP
jgi:tetratricopeptide (TPR) repeat protein